MCDQTLLWIGCGGCSGETQALLGVEGQASDLLDLIDVDGLRLLWQQVREFSKRILGVITAFTGQWPHSVPFRPGGATCPVGAEEIRRARAAVDDYAAWYAPTVLGGTLDDPESRVFWTWPALASCGSGPPDSAKDGAARPWRAL